MSAKLDSKVYNRSFWGILNAHGDFWTSLVFDSELKARQHIIDFWGAGTDNATKCLRTHRIVPVSVVITQIEEPNQ